MLKIVILHLNQETISVKNNMHGNIVDFILHICKFKNYYNVETSQCSVCMK